MWRVEQPNVPVQERQVHQHRRLLQVRVSAWLRPVRQAQLLHPVEYCLEFRQRQWPGVKENPHNRSPSTLHCVKEKRETYYTWDIAPSLDRRKYGPVVELCVSSERIQREPDWCVTDEMDVSLKNQYI